MFINLFQGFRIITSEECWHQSLVPLMKEIRENIGDGPVYLRFVGLPFFIKFLFNGLRTFEVSLAQLV